jgi:hypothetical protein
MIEPWRRLTLFLPDGISTPDDEEGNGMIRRLKALALKHFEPALVVVILSGIIVIAFLVNYKLAFLNFFFLPVILAGYHLGKKKAVLTAGLCVLLVALYHVFSRLLLSSLSPISLDEALNIVTWAGFLILTAAVIGRIAEQREAKLKSLQAAYSGVLEIMLRYLEVADERKPRPVRVAHLAGKIAAAAKMGTFHVENIKSAALLLEAGDLKSNLRLYGEMAAFMERESGAQGKAADDREKVLFKTTASLLKEVAPILANYFYHYVEEAKTTDKDLANVAMGSGIIALADLVDRLSMDLPPAPWQAEVTSLQDIRKLSGRAFPPPAVEALFRVVSSSR